MSSQRWQLWAALVALAVGATMLHYRIHTPGEDPTDLWPNLFSLIDLVLVSALFLFRPTALLGLLLNSFLAFLGIIMMADFSLAATLAGQVKVMPGQNFIGWLLATTFPDIMIALADFLTGLALYRAILAEK
ncbi:MAG: hypothetical protein WBV23_11055 [Desulfobaccales bacterium]